MTASCSCSPRCGAWCRHKPWQKELQEQWAELVKGKYDWAHLAMHLWPERVVPKCATDRSLAIAHGLEDVFWSEDADGKWQKRSAPTTPLETLIAAAYVTRGQGRPRGPPGGGGMKTVFMRALEADNKARHLRALTEGDDGHWRFEQAAANFNHCQEHRSRTGPATAWFSPLSVSQASSLRVGLHARDSDV